MLVTKTLIAILFLTFLNNHPKHQISYADPFSPKKTFKINTNFETYSEIEPLLTRWYLNSHACGPIGTWCCCSDGNGHYCNLMGAYFSCIPGGPAECTSDLGECEENPSNCGDCCTPCMS